MFVEVSVLQITIEKEVASTQAHKYIHVQTAKHTLYYSPCVFVSSQAFDTAVPTTTRHTCILRCKLNSLQVS